MVANFILAIMAIGLSGFAGYWASDRGAPVTFREMSAVTPTVAPGETMRIRHKLTRNRICRVHLEQIIYDGEGTRFVATDEDYYASPGRIGDDNFLLAVPIPINAAEGKARYRGVRTYYCNPVHHWFHWPIVLDTPDIEFEIKGPPVIPMRQLVPPGTPK